jgi:predicted amidohydrolase
MIVDPLGVVLAQGNDSEMILMSEISATKVEETRTRFPFLQDRR